MAAKRAEGKDRISGEIRFHGDFREQRRDPGDPESGLTAADRDAGRDQTERVSLHTGRTYLGKSE